MFQNKTTKQNSHLLQSTKLCNFTPCSFVQVETCGAAACVVRNPQKIQAPESRKIISLTCYFKFLRATVRLMPLANHGNARVLQGQLHCALLHVWTVREVNILIMMMIL